MDDTQQSRASDAAAAATRKRRSSILKSQRPPRTPFSELEFHVATPTDTAKSRRVSFSKRTGVAEFITNEATTTWKNFYEEHNKSLESSGNDSGAHAQKPTIGHLGKRIFEQQFQEVEAFDFMTSIDNHSSRNINTSLNKVNFTQQMASLECTAGEKSLLNPQANLEMSAFTDCRSNVFGEDFAIPTMGEMSGRIDVNFSAVQAIGSTSTELKDDLDLIQEDLRNAKSNVVCPGPFNDRRSLSEYIEVDFNSTQAVMRNDESDMSITDTIHSPKVQEVSKSSSIKIDKMPAFNKDWVADKENIAVFEGCTSPVNPASDKRKTIVYENDTGNISITQALPVNIIIPEQSKSSEKRKTIVYDSDSADISVTQAVPVNIMIVNKDKEKRKTIIYENDTGNISVTQAIPSNIILPDQNKTIISQDDLGNISITQANPMVKIISSNVSQVSHKSKVTNDFISNAPSVDSDRHKTIIYDNESLEISGFDNNMSITKPIDTKHLLSGNYKEPQLDIQHENHNMSASTRQNVFVYQASAAYNDKGTKDFLKCEATDSESTTYTDSESKESYENINANRYADKTQFLKQGNYEKSANIINNDTGANNIVKGNMPVLEDVLLSKNPVTEKRKTIVYDNDMGNLSITQAIPANLFLPTIITTQDIPANIILPTESKNTEKRNTMVYDNDLGNLSITQAIPASIILPTESKNNDKRRNMVYDNDMGNLSITQAIPANLILPTESKNSEKRKTIVYDNDLGNLSITQAIPASIILPTESKNNDKRRTMVYDNDMGNLSITQAIPENLILPTESKNSEKRKTIVYDNDLGNLSITQAIPASIILPTESKHNDKRRTMVYDNDMGNLSITQALPTNLILPTESKSTEKRKTIVYDNDMGNLSITRAIPTNIVLSSESRNTEKRKTIDNDVDAADISVTQAVPAGILLQNKDSEAPKSVYEHGEDISVTRAIPTNIILQHRNETESEHEINDISFTQVSPKARIISTDSLEANNRTAVIDRQDSEVTPDSTDKIVNKNESNNISKNDLSNKSMTKPSGDLQKSMINELLNISNKIGNDMNKSKLYNSNAQDLFIYQAEMLEDIVAKNINKLEQSQSKDSSDADVVRKRTSVSVAKADSNESYVEMNKSSQISQPRLLTLESTSVSVAKAHSNESYVEMNKGSQMSQPRLLTLESEEPPENLVSDEENDSNDAWNAPAKTTQSNTTDTKLMEKSRQTVIDDLLDMSQSSLDATLDNNDAPITIPQKELVTTDFADSTSNDSMKSNDINNETQTDKVEDMVIKDSMTIKQSEEPLTLEYKEEKKANMSFDILKNILKTKLSDIQKGTMKHRQKERKSDVDQDKSMNKNKSVIGENLNSTKSKNFRDANDTNELLEMLSDLTDKTTIIDAEEPKQLKEPVSRRMSQVSEANEPRRLSVAPRRLSIVLSREDMLNNISMAQAALQKSMEIDDSLEDTSITPTDDNSPPKPTRLSNEVVKKLQFEDDSGSETSVKSDIKPSPLKKTTFGDFSSTKDNKSKVIPDYLKDVSEDIKALMDDLVKPNADVIPFQGVCKGQLQKNPSTCSTQIQANLITSSQIDVKIEDSNSASTSSYNLGNLSTPSFGTDSKSLKSSLKSSKAEKPDNLKLNVICPKMASPSHTVSDKVLIFDHNNPLNNVLLVPPDYSNVHRYQPGLSVISAKGSESDGLEKISSINTDNFDGKIQQYNVESVLLSRSMDSSSNNASKCTSNQESIRVRELKDTKVNTLIAMKQNKELLETSSSLTLVDDTLTAKQFDVDIDMESQNNRNSSSPSNKKSPVTLIYQIDEKDNNMCKIKSEEKEQEKGNKSKKRNYSPTKRDKTKHSGRSSIDNTPKQISKMQKLSTSPYQPEKLKAEKDDSVMDVDTSSFNSKKSPSPKKASSPRKSKQVKDITVQRLITEYDFGDNIDDKALSKHIIKALSQSGSSSIHNTASIPDLELKSLEVVSSFTSSKNQMEMRDACSVTTTDTKSSARSCRSEWQPVKENESVAVSECDSSVNVVAKIDMLPFMGSHECEWEPSSSDTWSFRLLHARVRLTMRLAHRHDNATRTRVRADTPVLAVAMDVAHSDKKNTVASLCVNFAAETMRQYINRGCSKAGEVPALLRRCAGAARVALRWGRAMHEARLHLAYTVKEDGTLALKVANIPLRSVWEVTMRLQLVTEPPSTPWPRACDVTVSRIVSDIRVTGEEVEKLLANVPRDWGHVPRTIWKIFRYLKNKTRDDELLGLS